jgi:hypothetical protein
MMLRQSLFVALGVVVPLMAGCGGGKDPVLAKVGSKEITASDYREAYLAMKPQERPALDSEEGKRSFLHDLISKEVMEAVALRKYPELNEQQWIRLRRFRENELTDRVKKRLLRQAIQITPAMKDWAYENMKRERNLRAMLIPDPDAAEWVRRQLDEGAEFGPLAKDHSMQWVSSSNAGDLGWKKPGTFPYPVDVAVWEAEVGTTVGPVRSALGSYIVEVLGERPAEVTASRQDMDALLNETLLQPLYLDRQKAIQDSMRAATDPYYPSEGKAILNLKFFWEVPEDQADNPFAALDADRVIPTFSAQEETVLAVDFKNAPDWTVKDFALRLSWYPAGMWPRGESEEQLVEAMDMVLRDYLYLKAAADLGYENEDFQKKLESTKRQMRVNYFYHHDVVSEFAPDQGEIDAYFQANRDRYQAPESYKLAFFGSRTKQVIADLVQDWKAGATFGALRAKYEKRDSQMLAIGETEWLYSGEDALRDDMTAAMRDGGITDLIMRNDVAMAFQLITRRPPRILSYGEIKDQVDDDAKTAIVDQKLTVLLEEEGKKIGVTTRDKALAKLKIEVPEDSTPAAPTAAGR